MIALRYANLTLHFLLELVALAALGYWGFQTGNGPIIKIVLGLGAPLLAVLVMGTFISPKAFVPVNRLIWVALQLVIFGSAAAVLFSTGHHSLARVFALAVLTNLVVMVVWKQQGGVGPSGPSYSASNI